VEQIAIALKQDSWLLRISFQEVMCCVSVTGCRVFTRHNYPEQDSSSLHNILMLICHYNVSQALFKQLIVLYEVTILRGTYHLCSDCVPVELG
jgi:hypothetical protein